MAADKRTIPKSASGTGRWGTAGLFGASTFLFLAGLVLAWQFVQPAPPSTLLIATGNSDGAYHRFPEHYRVILARSGIDLRIIETVGSVENLALLLSETISVDLAFIQGGGSQACPSASSLAGLAACSTSLCG